MTIRYPLYTISSIVIRTPYIRYFDGGVSSVYLWDLEHGFAGVILIKKAGDGSKKIKGCWDSIHVVEVQVRKKLIIKIYMIFNDIGSSDMIQVCCYFLGKI